LALVPGLFLKVPVFMPQITEVILIKNHRKRIAQNPLKNPVAALQGRVAAVHLADRFLTKIKKAFLGVMLL
jgi:hypothetical protein